MKKILTIITVLFALNCTAAPQTKFPIFGKKKHGVRCGGKKSFMRERKQKGVAVGCFAVFVVVGGIFMSK